MSKIVVGMNSRPAIIPHRIDCGIPEDDAHRAAAPPSASRRPPSAPSPAAAAARRAAAPITRPGDAHDDPEAAPGDAGARSRARPRTGRRIRRPCRTSAWRRSRWRRARREARGGDVDRAHQREDAARALQEAADAGQPRCCRSEQQRADADRGRAEGTTWRGPSRSIAAPGHQAERRVAAVEEADQRGHAHRAEAEGLRQLRHHDGRRRPERVLVEVVHGRDQPGDAGRLDALLTCSTVAARCRC